MVTSLMLLLLVACGTPLRTCVTDALAPMRPHQQHRLRHIFTGAPLLPKTRTVPFSSATAPSTAAADAAAVVAAVSDVEQSVARLKKVLEREYITFFNPMERDYYADSVTFDDPLTNLAGLEAYQANVDMLAGRTWLGALLFKDARIQLHSVTGGRVRTTPDSAEVVVEPVTTRWTLRFTFRALPWSPTASFSGISEYTVVPGGRQGVLITQQADYWDSINLQPVAVSAAVAAKEDGSTTSSSAAAAPSSDYQSVDRSVALQHFLGQLRPGHFQAVTAGPELPYTTLRLGRGYEVRRYPTYTAVQLTSYTRRDEAFLALGSFTARMHPMAPAIITVNNTDNTKTMMWPLDYCRPGQTMPPVNAAALEQAALSPDFEIVTVPESVVAVRTFADAVVEPVVRRADRELRALLQRDGLTVDGGGTQDLPPLRCAQYDAVFSMGQRRSEVHIPLSEGGHPW